MKKGLFIAVIIGIVFGIGQFLHTDFKTEYVEVYDNNDDQSVVCLSLDPGCGYCPESTDGICYDYQSILYVGFPIHYEYGVENATLKSAFNVLFFVIGVPLLYLLIYKFRKSKK